MSCMENSLPQTFKRKFEEVVIKLESHEFNVKNCKSLSAEEGQPYRYTWDWVINKRTDQL